MHFQWNFVFMVFHLGTDFYVNGLNRYMTPAADNEFDNFTITKSNQFAGRAGANPQLDLLTITQFERQYITFNFKGKGNAQMYFPEVFQGGYIGGFTVVIGDGFNNNKVTIYKSKLKHALNETTVDGITSETDFRSYWVRWQMTEFHNSYAFEVAVGLCNDPYQNQVLSARLSYIEDVVSISLSTTIENSGQWQFASDNETLGGCKNYWDCHEGFCLDAWADSFLHGTCIPYSLHVSSARVGDGQCWTGMIPQSTTIITFTPTVVDKDVNYRECTVEIIVAVIGGSLGGMTVLLLTACIFYMCCIHISVARMRRKVGQQFEMRETSDSLSQRANMSQNLT